MRIKLHISLQRPRYIYVLVSIVLATSLVQRAVSAPTRAVIATGLAAAGLMSYSFARRESENQTYANPMPIYLGSGLLAAAIPVHGRILPAMRQDFEQYASTANARFAWGMMYLGAQIYHNPANFSIENSASYLASFGGMLPYAIDRNFGSVREFVAHPLHLPTLQNLAPIWMANQVSSATLELSSIALMGGLRYIAAGLIAPNTDAGDDLFRQHDNFLHYVLMQYAPAAAGSLSSAVCATAMTYAFPLAATLPGTRIPCYLVRLGARLGTRYGLRYMASQDAVDWEKQKKLFWEEEKFILTNDVISSFLMQHLWTSPAESYMRNLGAFAYDEYEHPVVNLHLAPPAPHLPMIQIAVHP